jgi:two-component system NtrC family sensor kinase
VRASIDDERFIAIQVFDSLNQEAFVDLYRHAGNVPGAVQLKKAVLHEGKEIGSVIVSMTPEPYLAEAERALRWNTIRTGAALMLAIVLILLVLQRRLLKPVRALAAAANRIEAQNFAEPVQLRGADELSMVGEAMELMRQALLRSFAELHGKNEELANHAATLEARVEERTEALSHSNTELNQTLNNLQAAQTELIESEKLASLGRLVAGVAHELNTPIGNAMTTVSTLTDYYADLQKGIEQGTLTRSGMNEIVAGTLEGQDLIFRNLRKAAEIIQHFKQLAIDQTTDMRRGFMLSETVEEVLFALRPGFKCSPIQIHAEIAEGLRMDSFPGPLGQVISNLVLNAQFHAFAERQAGNIHLSATRLDEERLQLICRDDGAGMSEDVRKHAFDPFFTTKLGQGGSGLGLHIVRNIITGLLGGNVELHSSPGQGCEFILTLPCVAPAARQDKDA